MDPTSHRTRDAAGNLLVAVKAGHLQFIEQSGRRHEQGEEQLTDIKSAHVAQTAQRLTNQRLGPASLRNLAGSFPASSHGVPIFGAGSASAVATPPPALRHIMPSPDAVGPSPDAVDAWAHSLSDRRETRVEVPEPIVADGFGASPAVGGHTPMRLTGNVVNLA